MFPAFYRLAALLAASFALGFSANAQSRSSLDSPTCMMSSEVPIYTQLLDAYSHELFIWHWYAYGWPDVGTLPNFANRQERFAACFERKSKGKCGWKASGSIRKALAKNRTDAWHKKPLKKLYEGGLPPASISFAMRSLGTCFGDDPALPTLEDVGLVAGEYDTGACEDLATRLQYSADELPADLARYESWGRAFNHYMTRPGNSVPVKACRVVPKAGLPYIQAYHDRLAQEQMAYENRTVAQRIAGLDAYGIAYSLVYRTVSHEHTPTRPLPEGAYEWVLAYAEQVADGYPEPPIPDVVQQWALEQPLDRFDAMEDPFLERARLRPYEINKDIWARRVQSRLNKVAPNEERISVTEGCSILWGYSWGDVQFGKRSPKTSGEAEYYRLLQQTPDKWSQVMCNETPVGIFYAAQARYEKEQYEASLPPKPNEWAEITQRLADYASTPNSSSNSSTSRPTTRCYNTGTTESGLTERVCFTN